MFAFSGAVARSRSPRWNTARPARATSKRSTSLIVRDRRVARVAFAHDTQLCPRGAEARRAEARAHPPDHRAAEGRARGRGHRSPLPLAARAARLGDAVGADDRRKRQPRHREAVPEVPPARGLPRRPARGARARHLPDRLLPPEDEGDPRDDEDASGGVRRAGAAPAGRAAAAALASHARRRTSSPPSSASRRGSSSTRTSAGCRSGSASRARTILSRSNATCSGSCRARTGESFRTCSSGTAAACALPARPSVRTAS